MAKQGVEAVDRALRLLGAFNRNRLTMTLTELAEATDMYKSTVLRIAASLERFGFLIRRDSGKFAIGQAARRLGLLYVASFDMGHIVQPELVRLAEQTGETASLYIIEGDRRVCLYRENSPRAARHHLEEGVVLPLTSGASGHILRAWRDPADPHSQSVMDQGYAVSLGERDPDLAAVAVPLLDKSGGMHGALALSGIITRFTPDKIEALLEALRSAAGRLRMELPATTGR